MKTTDERLIIYQVFPRIFTNNNPFVVANGSFQQNGSGKFNDFDERLLKSLNNLGINAIWLTGVVEHATKTSFPEFGISSDNPNVVKGEAGSPYAIKDFYDVCPVLATSPDKRMEEFEDLVKRSHHVGLKLFIDFVPNHTAREYHSDSAPEGVEDFGVKDDYNKFFSRNNNYYYLTGQQFAPQFNIDQYDAPYIEFPAKATGNDCFSAFCSENDWYETVKLNYGHDYGDNSDHFSPIPDTWLKMRDILSFWVNKGVDGFRCDMVFMVPLSFWHWVIPQIKEINKDVVFIGEIYDIGLYRPFLDYGCFDYLYDKVNLYDTLVGIETSSFSAAQLTSCWQTVDGIGDRMLNFLENHDEVRFASDVYAGDPVKVIPSLVACAFISRGPLMIYYGQEFGERGEENEGFAGYNHRTTIFDYWSYKSIRNWYNNGLCDGGKLNAHQKWLYEFYGRVLNLCNKVGALRNGNFFDLMYVNLRDSGLNPHRQFAFVRYDEESSVLIILNFDDKAVNLKINIPEHAFDIGALRKGNYMAEDLLWHDKVLLSFRSDHPVEVSVKSKSAVMLQIKNKQI